MKKLFIETTWFTSAIKSFIDDMGLADLQRRLLENPDAGKVMSGCGGLRKLRMADPKRGKGKRGGARVIYLHVPEVDWILLLDIYDKNEKDDLTPQKKKVLKRLAEEFKLAAMVSRRH